MKSAPKPRAPYHYDTNAASNESGLACKDATRAQQHHKDECDINQILERFGKTGQIPVTALKGTYGDFSGVYDYHTAMNTLIAAEEEFDALPAKLRAKFGNDPINLIDFMNDPQNKDEAIKLGLVNPISFTANNQPAKAAEKPVTDTPE
jgi:phage internal scaffolding protein